MAGELNSEMLVIKYHRLNGGAVLMDENFVLHRLVDLRLSAAETANFRIVDADTEEDITRIVLA